MNRKLKTAGCIYTEERYSGRCAKGRKNDRIQSSVTFRSRIRTTTKRKRHVLHMRRICTWAILHVTVMLSLSFALTTRQERHGKRGPVTWVYAYLLYQKRWREERQINEEGSFICFILDIDMFYFLAQRIHFNFLNFCFVLGTILSAAAGWFWTDNAAFRLWCLRWYMGSSSSLSSYSS